MKAQDDDDSGDDFEEQDAKERSARRGQGRPKRTSSATPTSQQRGRRSNAAERARDALASMALPPRLAQPGSLMVLRRATAVAPAARVFAPLRPAAAAWPLSAAAAVPGRRHTATESAADKQRPASAWGTGGYSINPSPGAVDGADGATPAPGSGTVWRRVLPVSLQQAPQLFLELSKARLAALVVLTTMVRSPSHLAAPHLVVLSLTVAPPADARHTNRAGTPSPPA